MLRATHIRILGAMGVPHFRYTVYRIRLESTLEQHWLVRTLRPGAPNPSEPACQLAEDLANAKAEVIVQSAVATADERIIEWQSVGRAFHFQDGKDDSSPLVKLHGTDAVSVWITHERGHPSSLFLWTATNESMFWSWIDDRISDSLAEELMRPATRLTVRFFTEADFALHEEPMFMAREVEWIAEHARRLTDTGLEFLPNGSASTESLHAEGKPYFKIKILHF